MVDYSKWDKLEVSDSDDDSGPTVTKLDAASSITIPARGSAAAAGKKPEISIRPSPEPTADDAGEGMSAEEYYRSFEGGTGDGPDAASGSTPVVASAVPDWTRNGYAGPGFLFCQGIDEATICVPAPPGTRARDVVVSINQAGLLTVSLSGSKVLARTVAYEVVGMAVSAATRTLAPSRDSDEEADAADDAIDWEVIDHVTREPITGPPNRLIRITLRKRPPAGLRVWWRRAFVDDPMEVDLSTIPDRFSVGGVDAASGGKKLSMQEVWDRAHEEFRKKIASQKQMELDVGPPGDDDSDDDADV